MTGASMERKLSPIADETEEEATIPEGKGGAVCYATREYNRRITFFYLYSTLIISFKFVIGVHQCVNKYLKVVIYQYHKHKCCINIEILIFDS